MVKSWSLKELVWAAALAGLLALGFSRSGGPQGPLLVTSSLGASSAVLFVLDPGGRRLAAYEAIPGEEGGLRLLGARKVEHDLLLARYRDLSEMSPEELRRQYDAAPEEGDPSDGERR